MSGLREKQKKQRRALIEAAAIKLFEDKGFELTTIDEIAEEALVSPATVYNYYGTKGELLLALVARGEEGTQSRLAEFVQRADQDAPADLIGDIICGNMQDTLNYLSRELWGHVVAYVATTNDPEVGPRYIDTIADYLVEALQQTLIKYMENGRLKKVDAAHFSTVLSRLERNHFLGFIYLKSLTQEEMLEGVRRDVILLVETLE
ncbi:TetR/AcrR family transcriptional regulator [Temperatibacter marinus]|uniref:TetR/AcrR family transcriptional regulator n=1 Tax=Temperatibacter marinus TaxID=1456591 RepID=A0AA52EHP3_9PROT|nr:TetR/AcrR family transcriptional regulator [Temperatibacter marinus]WND02980.1 TetR/AcrR family transcriptional regulator [Temperatibacter marinus]